MSEIRSQATPARDELAEKVFDLLTRVAEVGTSDRNVIAHGIAMGLEDAGWTKPRTVNSATELDALPEGSVIWYSLASDGVTIYKVMRKEYGNWMDATDLNGTNFYTPPISATVLFAPGEAG